jgi:hypothetical protein
VDFSASNLENVLAVCIGEASGGPEETVLQVRKHQPSFAATLYSAWLREGDPLNPGLRYELDQQRQRIDYYRAESAELHRLAPEALPLKGLQVAAHYPDDLVRYMNDLDYAVADEAALWSTCRVVVDRGWDVDSATFVRLGGRLEIMVSFRKPNEDRFSLPYGVEVGTHLSLGDLAGVPPLVELPKSWQVPEVKNLTMLLYERFEQPYRARDLVDAAAQFEALTGRHHLVAEEADRLDLWPEYAELRALLTKIDAPSLPPRVPDKAVSRARARRAARLVRPFGSPSAAAVRTLQRRMIYGGLTAPERRAWAAAESRMTTEWALRNGLLCFGLPLEGGPRPARAEVHERRGVVWADTPIGRFVLTAGSEVLEEDIASLPGSGGVVEPTARPADVPEPAG